MNELPQVIEVQQIQSLTIPEGQQTSLCNGKFGVARYRLTEGRSAGVEMILINWPKGQLAICPTRGMNLWKARLADVDCKWDSPVGGPIHPAFVAVDESSGIGWLDGFDELLARCGTRSFGAPEFDANGQLLFPLHGRASNLPAEDVQVAVDGDDLVVRGTVREARFLQYRVRLETEVRLSVDESTVSVVDRLTNESATSTTCQMLYHINLGSPLLKENSELIVACDKVAARDAVAQPAIESWSRYAAPQAGFSEQVYFMQPKPDGQGWVSALLCDEAKQQGFSLRYKADTLPCFTQWKNTVAEVDGYVTGLEPGTGYPNPRGFEEQQGRLVQLAAGETVEFALKIDASNSEDQLSIWADEIAKQQKAQSPELVAHDESWCVG